MSHKPLASPCKSVSPRLFSPTTLAQSFKLNGDYFVQLNALKMDLSFLDRDVNTGFSVSPLYISFKMLLCNLCISPFGFACSDSCDHLEMDAARFYVYCADARLPFNAGLKAYAELIRSLCFAAGWRKET